jgi:hypothetical protein
MTLCTRLHSRGYPGPPVNNEETFTRTITADSPLLCNGVAATILIATIIVWALPIQLCRAGRGWIILGHDHSQTSS